MDDEGWRWLTAVLTTSCELVPISCGVTVIFFGVRAGIKFKSDTSIHFFKLVRISALMIINKTTHINFTQDDIHHAADDDDEVKDVPGVSKVALQEEARALVNSKHYNSALDFFQP